MMNFIKDSANKTPIEDTVFAIVEKAKVAKQKVGNENVVDATIGSLYDENGNLVAFNSVFDTYDAIKKETKAAYAASFRGNPSFREQVKQWTIGQADVRLASSVIATPGGTGAVALTIEDVLEIDETLIIPDIAWGSYALMATDKHLKCAKYQMFDGEHFNIASLKEEVLKVIDNQKRICIIINDPCHNPTGYSLTQQEWDEIIDFMNECSKKVPCVILNDIAYIDYAYDLANSRKYMETFNRIGENVMVVIAFSCSKTLTSYGLRCGAAVILAQDEKSVKQAEIVFEKTARATWSNIPNAAMDNFTLVTTEHLADFMKEKAGYIDLLKQRSDILVQEAKACELPIYPYKEGFFVTIKVEDNHLRDIYHEKLMMNHIFTVKVNKGIRVAVCSLSVDRCYGLAKRLKDILDECR